MQSSSAKIAIVGTGVSGLVAARHLHPQAEITVYEAANRIGGHSNTVDVDTPDGTVGVDTGFIVFNDRNYPNFEPLLDELGVASQPSHMSFSVSDDGGTFEYAGTPRGVFAQRSHLASPSFIRMLADLRRFNREAPSLLALGPGEGPSLREFLADGGYGEWFVERLIVPQASAVWSADPEQMWSFPAAFLARFFANHGMLGLRDRPGWRTVTGGSRSYVDAISRPFADRIRLGAPVRAITRHPNGVTVAADGCETEGFDEVVIAAHADEALAMLADPSQAEGEILGAFPYQPNEAVLHTDASMMPRRRAAWASWNYHLGGERRPGATELTYWMNNLQGLETGTDIFVTLNRGESIDPAKVVARIPYSHPVFTPDGYAAQERHAEISGGHTHFCGAYWRWGFHEDGVVSALRALARRSSSPVRLPVAA